jgi:acetyl esterase/lipase
MQLRIVLECIVAVVSLSGFTAHAADAPKSNSAKPEIIALWPGTAPGDKGDIGEEKDTSQGTGIIRLANVSKPTITLFRPAGEKNTGAAVIVCPGGGYNILAYDLEGTEVCDWLNSIGVTGVLLKYRVPGRGGQRHTAPLQDAQRAIGMVRSRAADWGIDPKRIGILGFSAGGHLAATASNTFDSRTYSPVDDADKTSCRPDFTILIYPAYLTEKDDTTKLAPEIKVTKQTPPAFITMTADDPVHVENAYAYGLALKRAGVSAELHIYPKGGHGYGLRPSENAVSHWPDRAAEWMKQQELLKGK